MLQETLFVRMHILRCSITLRAAAFTITVTEPL
jgi:hypothetical protein